MTAVADAIEVLRKHIIPTDEQLEGYRRRIDAVCVERSDWRRRAEAAEAELTAVKNVLARHGFLARDYESLHVRLENAITAPRREHEQEIKRHNRAAIAHEDAARDLKHHTTCMIGLYNKAATHILFNLGDEPDYVQILDTLNAAIKAAAADKAKVIE